MKTRSERESEKKARHSEKTITIKSSFLLSCLTRLASGAFGKRSAVNLRSTIMMYSVCVSPGRVSSPSSLPCRDRKRVGRESSRISRGCIRASRVLRVPPFTRAANSTRSCPALSLVLVLSFLPPTPPPSPPSPTSESPRIIIGNLE